MTRYEGKDVMQFACPNCGYFAICYNIIGKKGNRVDYCGQCQTEFPLSGFDVNKCIFISQTCQCGHEPSGSTHNRGVAACIKCNCQKFTPTWIEVEELK